MFYGNERSKIVHSDICRYNQRISEKNAQWFYLIKEVQALGYRKCKCCLPKKQKKRRKKAKNLNLTSYKGLPIKEKNGALRIKTSCGNWIIKTNAHGALELLHKNIYRDKKAYHQQSCKATTIKEMLRYIQRHDEKPMPVMPIKRKKGNRDKRKKSKAYKANRQRDRIEGWINDYKMEWYMI